MGLLNEKDSRLFLLSNQSDARNTIKADNFGLHYDDYYSKVKQDKREKFIKRRMQIGGDFKPSFQNDHT